MMTTTTTGLRHLGMRTPMPTRRATEGLQNVTIPLQYVPVPGQLPATAAAGVRIDASPARPIYLLLMNGN